MDKQHSGIGLRRCQGDSYEAQVTNMTKDPHCTVGYALCTFYSRVRHGCKHVLVSNIPAQNPDRTHTQLASLVGHESRDVQYRLASRPHGLIWNDEENMRWMDLVHLTAGTVSLSFALSTDAQKPAPTYL